MSGGGADGLGDDLLRKLRPRAEAAVKDSLLLLEGAAKELLSRPGSGRIYERFHRASAPGEPPAPDTGRLRASITHEGPTWFGNTVEGEWGTNVEYADDLEYGTRRIAPRPWARRAEEETRPAVEARLDQL